MPPRFSTPSERPDFCRTELLRGHNRTRTLVWVLARFGPIDLRIELSGDTRDSCELHSPLAPLMGVMETPQRQQLNGPVAPPKCWPRRGEKQVPEFVRSRRRTCPMKGSAAPLPLPQPEPLRDGRLARRPSLTPRVAVRACLPAAPERRRSWRRRSTVRRACRQGKTRNLPATPSRKN